MADLKLHPGMDFTHRSWLSEDYKPLHCRITRIARGTVYWRPKTGGAPMCFPLEDFEKYGVLS